MCDALNLRYLYTEVLTKVSDPFSIVARVGEEGNKVPLASLFSERNFWRNKMKRHNRYSITYRLSYYFAVILISGLLFCFDMPRCILNRSLVPVDPQTANDSNSLVAQVAVVSERLPRVHVADVNFDEWNIHT